MVQAAKNSIASRPVSTGGSETPCSFSESTSMSGEGEESPGVVSSWMDSTCGKSSKEARPIVDDALGRIGLCQERIKYIVRAI